MLTEKELRQLAQAFFSMSHALYPGPRSLIDLNQVIDLLKEYSDAQVFTYEIKYERVDENMTRRILSITMSGTNKEEQFQC